MKSEKLKVGIIFGGKSGEHEVSLRSANQVMNALDRDKYELIPIAITKGGQWLVGQKGAKYMEMNLAAAASENGVSIKDSQKLVTANDDRSGLTNFIEGDDDSNSIDLILPIGHGTYIEDGKLQGMLEMAGVSYVFSGVLASALAMNKSKSKLIAKNAGLMVADSILLNNNNDDYNEKELEDKLGFPMVIKPNELGSSVGMTIVKTKDEISTGIEIAFKYGNEVLIEKFIKGRELTVAVMGRSAPIALPVVEIIPKVSEWFDYRAKYEVGGSEEVCPAEIPDEVRNLIQGQAVKVFEEIGCRDLARVDFIWDDKGDQAYFMEINTIPGMTATSLAPQAAKAAGMEFEEFIDTLINAGLGN